MLICLSASHKNTDFDLLEKLSVIADASAQHMIGQTDAIRGAVVVATCNRFEAYIDLDEPDGASPIPAITEAISAVGEDAGVDPAELRASLDLVHGNAVAQHLFAVASGLESVVVGEGEIAGQVRRALERARRTGTTSPELERLFQRAAQTSRAVKNSTGIGSEGRSLVRLALELASSRVSDWSQTRVLLVGTGRYAAASLAALRDRGATEIRVHSPSGRGERFAASHAMESVHARDFSREAALADVIVTCTNSDNHVVDAALLQAGRAQFDVVADGHLQIVDDERPAARALLIDLGLPRNIDPDVTGVDGIELLDLETIRIHAPLEEFNSTDVARGMVHRAARAFGAAGEELDVAPAVVALRKHIFDVLDGEIERARRRGDDDGSTEEALRHMAGVLLHTPMVRSREYARQGEQRMWIDGLHAVFGVRPGDEEPADSGSITAERA
ncbi:glutamyl-tRNA reductase [Agromyces atrinae]|uniref:Glutamyl-tRNA reductase n=1 Tax=Agromyces atrinae TaxID=592376 RepID=A0A4Q2M7Q7_9MICO|nr:glutamyl-tRNA reductase [Agromyces atrinae]NYD67719.1 glutamyl-tRNA reductase [Agromyces atrinae]RXZ88089.1 glutamyl-tRNA reductase [Agromyces atrinae]